MKTIPRNAVMQKAAIFFLKNCTPLCAYVYQKMPHQPSIYFVEQGGQCLDNTYDQRAIGYFFAGKGTNLKSLSVMISPLNWKDFRPLMALASTVSSMVGVRPLCF